MTSCINEVVLMGNLGHPPELKYFQDGKPHVRLSLATTEKWRDRTSGELLSDTQWHIGLFKGNLAQRVGDYMDVGDKLWLRGRIKNRQYTDDDGLVRSISEVHAQELKMIWTKNKTKELEVASAELDEADSEFFETVGEHASTVVKEALN